MMFFQCDKCHLPIDGLDDKHDLKVDDFREWHLCDDCHKLFVKWIHTKDAIE